MLGGAMALLAVGVAATRHDRRDGTRAWSRGSRSSSAAVDAGVLGVAPPFFLRQVNEDWLGRYRSWVYGSGFGWQVGAGVTTYIMTAAVFLTIAMGALTAGPIAALALGILFGLVRGLAVLLTARLRSTAELFELHRRFDALGEPVRRAVIVVQLAVAIVAIGAAFGVVAALVATAVALGARRRGRPARTPHHVGGLIPPVWRRWTTEVPAERRQSVRASRSQAARSCSGVPSQGASSTMAATTSSRRVPSTPISERCVGTCSRASSAPTASASEA